MVNCWLLCEVALFVIQRGSEENNNCACFEVRDGAVLASAGDGEAMQNNYREKRSLKQPRLAPPKQRPSPSL